MEQKQKKIKMSNSEYQKRYYIKNKESLNKKLCEPVVCEYCSRTVIKNNIKDHQTRPICFKTQELNKIREQRTNTKNTV